ncbi:hypothetical protein GGI35DRAFT_120912 [Trichoderma velutinum]
MADEQVVELSPAVKSWVQDREGDLSYRLVKIGQDDGSMEKINTDVVKAPTTAVAADNSPVSEAGTAKSWDMINHSDANDVAMAD